MRMKHLLVGAVVLVALEGRPSALDVPSEVEGYLRKMEFGAEDLARLASGQVIARAETGKGAGEILTVAAVRIRVPRERVVNYYGQMISYVDGQVTLAFGRFSTPPTLDDVRGLALDRNEVDDLKACRVGDCDLRVSGAGLDSFRASVDWNASDHVERVNAFFRQAAVNYVADYQKRGDAALVTYDDRERPVGLQQEWRGILANSPYFHEYVPELKDYLERFPGGRLPGARDIIYWVKEFYGLKPVVSLVHGVIYQPPARSDRTFVVQKQIYASHYYDGSLAMASLIDATEDGRPVTYLIYGNRSRGDLLKGGFGGLQRTVARDQARKAAVETLGAIKDVLEGAR
jgi:hypothetical protein